MKPVRISRVDRGGFVITDKDGNPLPPMVMSGVVVDPMVVMAERLERIEEKLDRLLALSAAEPR